MHAINACYGSRVLTPEDFKAWCDRYDAEYAPLGLPSASNWDGILANQENIIAYILRHKSNHGVLYCPPNHIKKTLNLWEKKFVTDLVDPMVRRMFVFNSEHVWLVRWAGQQWVSVDSMKGVVPININSLINTQGLGIMPVLSVDAVVVCMANIKRRVRRSVRRCAFKGPGAVYTREDLNQLVCAELDERKGITEFEVDMCTFFHFYKLIDCSNQAVKVYDLFFERYQQRPADLVSVVQYVPALLHYICVFDENVLRCALTNAQNLMPNVD
jgi:hypothetical protein